MTDPYLKFFLNGCDGSRWNLTDEDKGVLLRPGPQKFIDAPAKTFWIESSSGSHYQGVRFERRDPVFSVQIHGRDPMEWADRDSRFRMALGMVGEDVFELEAHSPYGIRRLKCRLLTEPIAYEQADYEGKSPWLYHDSTLGISAACEQPFWEADPVEFEWELPSGTSGSVNFAFQNRGDVPVFWYGFATAPAKWVVPDRSWGQKIWAKATPPYHRAIDDAARSVPLPELFAGEDVDINSDPDERTLVAANGAPVLYRWNSNGLLYPIRPHLKPEDGEVTVSVTGANPGAGIKIWIPRRYSRPWGVMV
ncbi:hypothetical protein [Nocardia wallacei]|uniref:hypothetical protein n=1 Tax=Nocardia wallacei TaxID=480035 RepID=UPI002455F2F2|nr:hypothetical protein [Nocardia wallacei]